MSKPRTLFVVAGLLSGLIILLWSGSPSRPEPALAADCAAASTGTLVIEIFDHATDSLLTFGGARVLVNPDPTDFVLDQVFTDSDVSDASATQDSDEAPGVLRLEDACATQGAESYTASLYGLPGVFDDCAFVVPADTGKVLPGGTTTLNLEVDCTEILPTATVGPTSTPTATATPMAPSQVSVIASPLEVSCTGTSVITATVRDGASTPVGPGTVVTLSTSFGTLSPSGSQVTNNAGNVVAFFTAPASSGGLATISAVSGTLKGMAAVNVKCGGTAAISSVTPSSGTGVIKPPNTGNAGLAQSGRSGLLAGGVIILAVVAGGATLLGRRLPASR